MFVSLSVGFLAIFLCVLKRFLCSISKKLLMLRLYSYPDLSFNSMVGIKQLTFGGSEFENWKENLKSEDAGYSVHKI